MIGWLQPSFNLGEFCTRSTLPLIDSLRGGKRPWTMALLPGLTNLTLTKEGGKEGGRKRQLAPLAALPGPGAFDCMPCSALLEWLYRHTSHLVPESSSPHYTWLTQVGYCLTWGHLWLTQARVLPSPDCIQAGLNQGRAFPGLCKAHLSHALSSMGHVLATHSLPGLGTTFSRPHIAPLAWAGTVQVCVWWWGADHWFMG